MLPGHCSVLGLIAAVCHKTLSPSSQQFADKKCNSGNANTNYSHYTSFKKPRTHGYLLALILESVTRQRHFHCNLQGQCTVAMNRLTPSYVELRRSYPRDVPMNQGQQLQNLMLQQSSSDEA